MAKLNLDKAIEEGKKQAEKYPRYCLRIEDMRALASKDLLIA